MIHFRFTKKNVKRLVTTMLLIAPIVYLFGSLFTGLNGAHGTQIFADGEETSEKSYDELMEVENFNYGSFDWSNEHGTRLGFSLGLCKSILYYEDLENYTNEFFFTPTGVGYGGGFLDYGLGFSSSYITSSNECYLHGYIDGSWLKFIVDDFALPSNEFYSCFYLVGDGADYVIAVCFTNSLVTYFQHYEGSWTYMGDAGDLDIGADVVCIYFDDGAHLPEGVSWTDELASYFVPKVKVTETQTFSDYVFGQFFARDNFLSEIGKDALSDDPHGFAPFAAMLSFVDENMLNIGSLQVGLMAYGYFYWCAHVLLLTVLFDLTTFFITWISHIGDKFGGNADE